MPTFRSFVMLSFLERNIYKYIYSYRYIYSYAIINDVFCQLSNALDGWIE